MHVSSFFITVLDAGKKLMKHLCALFVQDACSSAATGAPGTLGGQQSF